MGFLGFGRRPGEVASPSRAVGRRAQRLQSPWTTNQLASVVVADVFGEGKMPVTRAEAMTVPAVAKARHLVTSLGRNPLREYEGDALAAEQPAWTSRTDSETAAQTRMVWTLDDLFFGGWSLWQADRDDTELRDAIRVPPEWWSFDVDGGVLVDDVPAKPDEVILFSGPYEGLLEAGARTIRAARNLEEAWAKRVRTPIPLVIIKQTVSDDELGEPIEATDADGNVIVGPDGEPLTIDEGQDIVAKYIDARLDPNGAVSFVPYGYELETKGDVRHELFVEGRNAVTLDIARFAGVAANLLDASLSTASLTYTTTQGNRSDFLDMTAPMWLGPIEARLSMDDVCAPGRRVAFDLSNLTTVPATGLAPATED